MYDSAEECLAYEKTCAEVDALYEWELSGLVPLGYEGIGKCANFDWYVIRNNAQKNILQTVFTDLELEENLYYPEYLCVERLCDDIYFTTLTRCNEAVCEFFEEFGVDVEFSDEKE